MFGMKKAGGDMASSDIETIIGKDTQIKGQINGSGNTRVDGLIEGEINIEGDAVIGEQGRVIGNIVARSVLISGEVKGNITASNKLEILPSGRLFGDVKVAILSISEGAVFKGNSCMDGNARPEIVEPE